MAKYWVTIINASSLLIIVVYNIRVYRVLGHVTLLQEHISFVSLKSICVPLTLYISTRILFILVSAAYFLVGAIAQNRTSNALLQDSFVPKVETARNLGVTTYSTLVETALNLGVTTYSTLQLDAHISNITRNCYFHIGLTMHIRPYISQGAAKSLIHTFCLSSLDHCNNVLVGLPRKSTDGLQRVMNASAKLIICKRKYDHITELLQQLHRMPVKEYKQILTILYKGLPEMAPKYLSDLTLHTYHLELCYHKTNFFLGYRSNRMDGIIVLCLKKEH